MGKQFSHEGINNKMMGTETVEPVAQHDISGGQCGAVNDKIILPGEWEIEKIPPNVLELEKRINARKHPKETLLALCLVIKKSRKQNTNSIQSF